MWLITTCQLSATTERLGSGSEDMLADKQLECNWVGGVWVGGRWVHVCERNFLIS